MFFSCGIKIWAQLSLVLSQITLLTDKLAANINGKLAFSVQRGHFDPKFQVEGSAPTNHSSCH